VRQLYFVARQHKAFRFRKASSLAYCFWYAPGHCQAHLILLFFMIFVVFMSAMLRVGHEFFLNQIGKFCIRMTGFLPTAPVFFIDLNC